MHLLMLTNEPYCKVLPISYPQIRGRVNILYYDVLLESEWSTHEIFILLAFEVLVTSHPLM